MVLKSMVSRTVPNTIPVNIEVRDSVKRQERERERERERGESILTSSNEERCDVYTEFSVFLWVLVFMQ